MKNNTVEEIVEQFFKVWVPFEVEGDHEQFSEGIFISDVEEAKERLRTTLTQHHQDELREVYREILDKQRTDEVDGTRVYAGDIKALAHSRGIDISDKTDTK